MAVQVKLLLSSLLLWEGAHSVCRNRKRLKVKAQTYCLPARVTDACRSDSTEEEERRMESLCPAKTARLAIKQNVLVWSRTVSHEQHHTRVYIAVIS